MAGRKYLQITDTIPFSVNLSKVTVTHVERNKKIILKAGEWNFKCCDCDLVHNVIMYPSKTKIKVIMKRDNRATSQLRRFKKK